MSVQRLRFSATIAAPAATVWRLMFEDASYRRWTSAFCEGSHYEGTWEPGARIRFLAPNGDGIVSEIAELRPQQYVSVRHLGYVLGGVEDTTSESVRAWAPAYENYRFTVVPEGTRLDIEQEVAQEWRQQLADAWPKALALLKQMSEDEAAQDE